MSFLKKVGAFFKKNLGNLILAVVFSVIIWFAVSIQIFPNVYDHVDGVAVTAEPTAYMQEENLQIIEYTDTVSIQIQGKRYTIGMLTAEDFTASLDLTDITSPGTHTVNVILGMVKANNDCEIISTGLTSKVTVQRIISKDIPLEVNTANLSVGEGLQIQADDIEISATHVTVRGDEALVNSVARAVIEPVYDGTMNETTAVSGAVSLYNAAGTKIENSELEYQVNNYSVTIPVYRVKTLPLNVSFIYPENFDSNSIKYSIVPQEITIAAPASDTAIENLNRIDIGEINLTGIAVKDLQGVNLAISLPDGYKNLSNTGRAQVNFENIDSYGKLEFTVSTDNFTVLNGDPEYVYSFVTSQFGVTAIGPSGVLQNLSQDDITGTVNLLGIPTEEGVKNVTVTLRIAGQNVTAWISGEYKIDIRATKVNG
ncbi:MAG: hypothetical protein J1F60_03900 [Oscillospiraceae bacterium]|nr:hypothetical protein [Oscillospiraceae bacterium]